MTTPLLFPGFDGLMTLSRREGVDIRPTLLRVLTDLYVQADAHSADEERQFIELTSRLIEEVDDATRAAVRARLAIYPGTPVEVLRRLGLRRSSPDQVVPVAPEIPAPPPVEAASAEQPRMSSNLSMQPNDAAEISDMFFRANANERALILHNFLQTPLKASARIPAQRAARAIETLEMAAFAADIENFTLELGEALILPARVTAQVVNDPGGEPLACAAKALDMPGPVFQRVAQQVLEYLHTPHDVELPPNRQVLLARRQVKEDDLEDSSPDHLGEPLPLGTDDSLASAPRAPAPTSPANVIVPASMREREGQPVSEPKPAPPSEGAPIAAAIQNAPRLRESGTVVLEVEQGGIVVPSFLGKNVRVAIEVAADSGLDLDVVGSGMAKEQDPLAGAHVAAGSRIRVRFGR